MDVSKLTRFCELKAEHRKLEEELEALRRQIIADFPEDTEISLPDHTLKIIYQEKRHYDDRLLLEALPDPDLWKVLFKPDSTKISALVKANVLPESLLDGTYRISKVPYIYVNS